MGSETGQHGPRVSGACYASFAYDVGFAVDLERAQGLIAAAAEAEASAPAGDGERGAAVQRGELRHHRRAPKSFQFRPAPLVVTREARPMEIMPGWSTAGIEYVVYDFGAVSVTYRIPIEGERELGALQGLGEALYDCRLLLTDSRERVTRLMGLLSGAISSPMLVDTVEDYVVHRLSLVEGGGGRTAPAEFIEQNRRAVAQILRGERERLSEREIADALSARIAYGEEDEAVIDFSAAILVSPDAASAAEDEVRDVLEFANVELLEMRYLDDQLDAAMESAYRLMSRDRSGPGVGVAESAAERLGATEAGRLARLARMQVDGAVLYEAVNNSLKLIGDHYLARVYRLAAQRMHLPDWDASIMRKIQTLESIYQKVSDRQTNRRMEILEWIIIVLIALEIVISFVPGLRH
ncbi:MAG: hypothetical protein KF745_07845 [Phycisphaeraceae bacterium]|nr:hypothetical protein [Phycisphaeraceae bacterium]